ncbi:hypothetical protein [Streptomyces sp. NRRL B-24484]|uniref:hypothetical protein n=1 Tax=Streptomyces sp. NRRL B-24484 TaxID=1463833 RepID=UPI0013311CDD|nr:hypothetical protein [Streptomyces sp. NRRL B-24484]
MSTAMVLLLIPLALAAVLTATAPSPARRHRGPRAAAVRTDRAPGPRHARSSR